MNLGSGKSFPFSASRFSLSDCRTTKDDFGNRAADYFFAPHAAVLAEKPSDESRHNSNEQVPARRYTSDKLPRQEVQLVPDSRRQNHSPRHHHTCLKYAALPPTEQQTASTVKLQEIHRSAVVHQVQCGISKFRHTARRYCARNRRLENCEEYSRS